MTATNFRGIVYILILYLLISTGCSKGEVSSSAPNIILITIDTLRADHLSCYGYDRQTSPFIDSIAKESAFFTNAYSTSSWTAPSMASIFTGLYPRAHGVVHGVTKGSTVAVTGQEMLVKKITTIAEWLKNAGYTTFGISSNGHISRGTGFAQGFDHFDTHWFMKSPASNVSVKKWLENIHNSRKYFLWIHYFDPHNPYAPQLPWYKSYIAQRNSYSKWLREVMPNPKEFIEELKQDPNGMNVLKDRYDSEINYCDYHIKEMFALLQPGENTLVVITADHGEAFLEHGQLLHGDTLYEEEIKIPLIIQFPGKDKIKKTITQPVSNRNIAVTIADFIGLKTKKDIPGISLMPLISGKEVAPPESFYFELDWNGWAKGIHHENWKFLLSRQKEQEKLLFDLNSDPAEQNNVINQFPEQALLLEKQLQQWLTANPQFAAPLIRIPVDKNQESKLRTLGYIQ